MLLVTPSTSLSRFRLILSLRSQILLSIILIQTQINTLSVPDCLMTKLHLIRHRIACDVEYIAVSSQSTGTKNMCIDQVDIKVID